MAMTLRNKAVIALLKEKFTPKEVAELFDMPVGQVTTLRCMHRGKIESGLPIGAAEEYKPGAMKKNTAKYRALSVLQALGPMTVNEIIAAMAEFGQAVHQTNVSYALNSLMAAGKVTKGTEYPAVWSAV